MRTLYVALVGCGVMGSELARTLQAIKSVKLIVVCDSIKEAAKNLSSKLEVPYTTDLDKVLDRKRLDSVIVATPSFMHKKVCVAVAKSGKHIFVEKPLAPSVKGCNSIIMAAKKAGIKLMVGQVCRYHGTHLKIRDMVKDGVIGKPNFMEIHRLSGGWSGIWDKSWRLTRKQSGGTLMEVNAHEIDFMRFVCGDVKSVFAVGGLYRHTRQDFPDVTLLSMKFKEGGIGVLHSSQASALRGYGGRIDGTEGSLHFPKFEGEGGGIQYKKWDSEIEFIPSSELKVVNPFQAELQDWLNSIQRNLDPPIRGEEGRAAVQIAEAAYESIETGKLVEL